MRIEHDKEFAGENPASPKRIFWMIPTFDSNTWVEYTVSFGLTMGLFAKLDIECEIYPHIGDCFIEKARCMAVARFMHNPDNTHLVMCDADQSWKIRTIHEIIDCEHEVVSVCPPLKTKGETYTAKDISNAAGNFAEVERVGTGLVVFKRSVFEKMFKAYENLRCYDYDYKGGCGYSLFRYQVGEQVTGEDFVFMDRWRNIGGKVHIHTNAPMRHKGNNVWEGNINTILNKCEQPPTPITQDEIDKIPERIDHLLSKLNVKELQT